MDETFSGTVRHTDELKKMPGEYKQMLQKIVVAHMVNEMAGAEAFDVPAIGIARNSEEKWMALQIAQDEYSHHVQFMRMARTLDVDPESVDIKERANRAFDLSISTWTDFLTIKALVDLGEVVMIDDLKDSSYEPLRQLSLKTMPEERFHTGFGRSGLKKVVQTEEGKADAQMAANRTFPFMLGFFGGSKSKNNDAYRRWRIKYRTNDEMRADYIERVQETMAELGLEMPLSG